MSQAQLARAANVAQPNISAYENGRREPSAAVLERIRAALVGTPASRVERYREQIRRLVRQHHATDPRVFGSVARGEDTADSDLDLLVDFTPDATLLDAVGLQLDLTDLLHIDVDVVAADSLRGEVRDRIFGEAVPL